MTLAAPRILALSKRRYMSRDLLVDRYGRFRELPLALARLGATVEGLCLAYSREPALEVTDGDPGGVVRWTSLPASSLLPAGRSYWNALDRIRARLDPEVVFAGSDVIQLRLGVLAARRFEVPLVVDLYDNFESYGLARFPGANLALRSAVRRAAAVTVISQPLAAKVVDEYGVKAPVRVVENAIPAGLFHPRDRGVCRRELGLPDDTVLVGTAGALSQTRGIKALFEAFDTMSRRDPRMRLVLAGPLDGTVSLPVGDRVHYLGMLPADAVPTLLGALDVSVVCNRDSSFGRYCFPQKLYESLACGIPTVVARVGAMASLLQGHPHLLFEPDDAASLDAAITAQLAAPGLPGLPIPDWRAMGGKLLEVIREALPR